jgi:hypothetical protein
MDINADMSACEAALWNATSCPDTAILEFLIAKGANVKECGSKALCRAADMHNPREMQLVLRHGTHINFIIESRGSALKISIASGQWGGMEAPLGAGTDINLGEGECGTPLQQAIERGSKVMAMELLRRGEICESESWSAWYGVDESSI